MISKAPLKSRLTGEERRALIAETACKLFSEKGFRGTTTRELAAAAGVTEPVLYEHFKTKRDLYGAIIEAKALEGMHAVTALTEAYKATDDDHGFFQELARGILAWYGDDPSFIRLLLFSNLEDHELKGLFQERIKGCFDLIVGHIERRIEQGAMQPVDPVVAARGFFGMIAHYAMTGVVFCNPLPDRDTADVIRGMVDIYVKGLCKDKKR